MHDSRRCHRLDSVDTRMHDSRVYTHIHHRRRCHILDSVDTLISFSLQLTHISTIFLHTHM